MYFQILIDLRDSFNWSVSLVPELLKQVTVMNFTKNKKIMYLILLTEHAFPNHAILNNLAKPLTYTSQSSQAVNGKIGNNFQQNIVR